MAINANYVVDKVEEVDATKSRYTLKRTGQGNIELIVMLIPKQEVLKVGMAIALDMEVKVAIPMPVLAEIKDVGNTTP